MRFAFTVCTSRRLHKCHRAPPYVHDAESGDTEVYYALPDVT